MCNFSLYGDAEAPDPAQAVEAIRERTGGRGADVAIEALGTQQTFVGALRVIRPVAVHIGCDIASPDQPEG
jgi:threonine dehydrogenase-like Zn-dependent dehydrogenase